MNDNASRKTTPALCPKCRSLQSLREINSPPAPPHDALNLVWSDPGVPTISVYYCGECKGLMIRNSGDSIQPWK